MPGWIALWGKVAKIASELVTSPRVVLPGPRPLGPQCACPKNLDNIDLLITLGY